MTAHMTLVSHPLCPYVQRVAITLHEKGLAFDRRNIDLAHKPDWFLALSPTGKTPLLLVDGVPIFESSVICEYLEDVHEPRLHPADPLARARHRAWMEFASTVLAAVASFYNASTDAALSAAVISLQRLLAYVEKDFGDGPYFAGETFSIVDAAFAPALRYFDVIDDQIEFRFFDEVPKVAKWREHLSLRPSVREAVLPDYAKRLHSFLLGRNSALSRALAARDSRFLPGETDLNV